MFSLASLPRPIRTYLPPVRSYPAITRMIEYLPILIIIIFSLLLSCVIVFASYLLALRRGDAEKVSVYESGFDPVGDSRQKFAVRFFLVAIVFIIFDLEVSFLFP